MPRGRPSKGRQMYIRIKLKTTTHSSWTTRKKSLGMKSDDELARYLLDNSVLDGSFNGGGYSADQQASITSSIRSPVGPPNHDILFSTPIREATLPIQQRSLQIMDISSLT